MTQVATTHGTLYVFNCSSCGIAMGVPTEWDDDRRDDGRSIHCPNGHTMSYTDATAKKLQREREHTARLTARLDQERAEREAANRRAAAARGQVTKMRNRVARGVCPCCNRTFADLAAHMQTKHPDYLPSSSKGVS